MHRWSRRVGRSINTTQTATLVTNALDMAIRNRGAQPGVVTHSDHGAKSRLTPWAFAGCAHASGLGAIVLGPDASPSAPLRPRHAHRRPVRPCQHHRAARSQFIIGARHFLVAVWHRLASHAVGSCELEACSFHWPDRQGSSSAMSGTCQNRLADVVM